MLVDLIRGSKAALDEASALFGDGVAHDNE
jgi:hypothetical protein